MNRLNYANIVINLLKNKINQISNICKDVTFKKNN